MGEGAEGARRFPILAGTLKTVVAVALLSCAASYWLSGSELDQRTLNRLAAATSRGLDDPLTTGSLGKSANATRLDPCALPRRN